MFSSFSAGNASWYTAWFGFKQNWGAPLKHEKADLVWSAI